MRWDSQWLQLRILMRQGIWKHQFISINLGHSGSTLTGLELKTEWIVTCYNPLNCFESWNTLTAPRGRDHPGPQWWPQVASQGNMDFSALCALENCSFVLCPPANDRWHPHLGSAKWWSVSRWVGTDQKHKFRWVFLCPVFRETSFTSVSKFQMIYIQ